MSIFSSSNHSFNRAIAAKYGVEEAILIHHFIYWIENNRISNKHIIEGRCWTYDTREKINEHFPYFTFNQVRRICERLVKKGVLITGNYNQKKIDKTLWYAFKDEKVFGVDENSVKEKFTKGNSAFPEGNSATPLPHNKTTHDKEVLGKDIKHIQSVSKKTFKERDAREKDVSYKKIDNKCSFREEEKVLTSRKTGPILDQFDHEIRDIMLKGKARIAFEELPIEKKRAFQWLLNVPPLNSLDLPMNPIVGLKLVKKFEVSIVEEVIKAYKKATIKNNSITNSGAYLHVLFDIMEKQGIENFDDNYSLWIEKKKELSKEDYKEYKKHITFPGIAKDIGFTLKKSEFAKQLDLAIKLINVYKNL